ncbi:MAG: hypothetical protein KDB61_06840, partial [Planctomycetes bacterium]|nr:hypothetical protein [Planctomycetota bacterium]
MLLTFEGAFFYLVGITPEPTVRRVIMACTLLLTYQLFAYLIKPSPDYDNLGLFRGLFNHPFR